MFKTIIGSKSDIVVVVIYTAAAASVSNYYRGYLTFIYTFFNIVTQCISIKLKIFMSQGQTCETKKGKTFQKRET